MNREAEFYRKPSGKSIRKKAGRPVSEGARPEESSQLQEPTGVVNFSTQGAVVHSTRDDLLLVALFVAGIVVTFYVLWSL